MKVQVVTQGSEGSDSIVVLRVVGNSNAIDAAAQVALAIHHANSAVQLLMDAVLIGTPQMDDETKQQIKYLHQEIHG